MTARDSVDELGDALFAAARRERPSDVVRERVVAAIVSRSPGVDETAGARKAAVGARGGKIPGRSSSQRSSYGAVGALALAAIVTLAVVMVRKAREEPSIAISAERTEGARELPSARLARIEEPRDPVSPVTAPPAEPKRAAVAARTRDAGRGSRDDRGAPKPMVAPPASLTDEIATLDRARNALSGGDSAAALRALDDYDQRLHGTRLTAEATLLRIDALARSGHASAASVLASRFVEENPGSALADRARAFIDVAAGAAEKTNTNRVDAGGLP